MADDIEKKPREQQAPVLGEDKAQPSQDQAGQSGDDAEKALDLPLEENQFNSQPG